VVFCLPLLALSVTAAVVLFRGFPAMSHEPRESLSGSVALLEEDEEEDV